MCLMYNRIDELFAKLGRTKGGFGVLTPKYEPKHLQNKCRTNKTMTGFIGQKRLQILGTRPRRQTAPFSPGSQGSFSHQECVCVGLPSKAPSKAPSKKSFLRALPRTGQLCNTYRPKSPFEDLLQSTLRLTTGKQAWN